MAPADATAAVEEVPAVAVAPKPPRPRTDRIAAAVERLVAKLPRAWRVRVEGCGVGRPSAETERPIVIRIAARGGHRSTIVCLASRRASPADVPPLVARLGDLAAGDGATTTSVVLAPYLSARVRAAIRTAGVGYADSTGNVAITVADPYLRVEARGAERSPTQGRYVEPRLGGAKAARVLRALLDAPLPVAGVEIAQLAACDQGYVSRILAVLVREGVVEKGRHGPVTAVDREATETRLHRTVPVLAIP